MTVKSLNGNILNKNCESGDMHFISKVTGICLKVKPMDASCNLLVGNLATFIPNVRRQFCLELEQKLYYEMQKIQFTILTVSQLREKAVLTELKTVLTQSCTTRI